MAKYNIPVTFEVSTYIEIKADSLEQALETFGDNLLPPNDEWEYIEASLEVNGSLIKYCNRDLTFSDTRYIDKELAI